MKFLSLKDLARLTTTAVIACTVNSIFAWQRPAESARTIETAGATLRIDAASCDLVGVHWKSPALDVIDEPSLGENFRLLLPTPGYEAAYFNSRDQKVSRIEASADGVTCYYRALKNEQEEVPLEVWYKIRFADGQIQFSIEVANPTGRKLAEVFYGILGGLKGIGDRHDTQAMVPGGTENLLPKPFTSFQGGLYGGGNLGIRYDATGFTYPGSMPMGWMDVYNQKEGLGYYYGNQDPDTRLTSLYFEMRPFTKSAVVFDNWPSPDDVPPGEPVGLTMGWVDFPYTANDRFDGGPVALQVHNGDWHTASSIYRTWFDQHFTISRPLSWLRQQMAWQSIIMSNPEDVIVHRFSELPKLAADAKKFDINTFEILGWDMGGIDRGYPQYRPNPRLGTPEEFRDALARIRAIGVHPLLFANVQVADTATPIFRNDLSRYEVEGRWAPDLTILGWGEGTIGSRLGLARSNMTFVSPAHPEFRKFLMDQFTQMVRDGADGFQLDKTGANSVLDFNPTLPVSPDKSLFPGIVSTFQELLEKARAINPNFALASEIWEDRALPYVDVSYMRMGKIDMGSTALRYTFPEWTSTIFGESPGDFNPMNNGMRYGLVWDLAPRHYNDSVDDTLTRPLARYVAELIRIRKQYQDLLFDGRFNDTLGADVTSQADIRYSVFNSLDPGNRNRAAVVVNFGNQPETAAISFPGRDGEAVEISAPFEPDRKASLPLHLTIPPSRCVVIVSRETQAK
jgi:hypothetical protein